MWSQRKLEKEGLKEACYVRKGADEWCVLAGIPGSLLQVAKEVEHTKAPQKPLFFFSSVV